eukprot:356720-Chlamydomonas_euryale.AAC.3
MAAPVEQIGPTAMVPHEATWQQRQRRTPSPCGSQNCHRVCMWRWWRRGWARARRRAAAEPPLRGSARNAWSRKSESKVSGGARVRPPMQEPGRRRRPRPPSIPARPSAAHGSGPRGRRPLSRAAVIAAPHKLTPSRRT